MKRATVARRQDRSTRLSRRSRTTRQGGFSLLELLVVVAILVAVAFIASSTFRNVDSDTQANLVRAEMLEVANAIKQFRSDTGYYPKEGIFDSTVNGGQVDISASSGFPGSNDSERNDWFESPANLMQLIQEPQSSSGSVLPWNASIGRGWRGPYLQRELLVDVGDNLQPDGQGDPASVTANHLENMYGIGDPFEKSPVTPGSGSFCFEAVANGSCLFDWRVVANDGDTDDQDGDAPMDSYGSPYLLFNDPSTPSYVTGCNGPPCLLSLGPDGLYAAGQEDDIVLNLK